MTRNTVVRWQFGTNLQRMVVFGPFRRGELVKSLSFAFLDDVDVVGSARPFLQAAMVSSGDTGVSGFGEFDGVGTVKLIDAIPTSRPSSFSASYGMAPITRRDVLEIVVHAKVDQKRYLAVVLAGDNYTTPPDLTMMVSVLTDSADPF